MLLVEDPLEAVELYVARYKAEIRVLEDQLAEADRHEVLEASRDDRDWRCHGVRVNRGEVDLPLTSPSPYPAGRVFNPPKITRSSRSRGDVFARIAGNHSLAGGKPARSETNFFNFPGRVGGSSSIQPETSCAASSARSASTSAGSANQPLATIASRASVGSPEAQATASRFIASRPSRVIVFTAPKSTIASRPPGIRRKLPGWGSALKRPTTSIDPRQNRNSIR